MELGYTEPDPRDDLSGVDVGRKALILGRLLGFAGEPADVVVESLVPAAMRALPPRGFLARLPEHGRRLGRRAAAAKAKGATLRYVATVTKNRISVGLKVVDRSSPFFGLKGTDNQVAFTTSRYRKNPLVITGPGAGPAVTAPACSTTCSASAADRRQSKMIASSAAALPPELIAGGLEPSQGSNGRPRPPVWCCSGLNC